MNNEDEATPAEERQALGVADPRAADALQQLAAGGSLEAMAREAMPKLMMLSQNEAAQVFKDARDELRKVIPLHAIFPPGMIELVAACTRLACERIADKNGFVLQNDSGLQYGTPEQMSNDPQVKSFAPKPEDDEKFAKFGDVQS